MKYFEFKNVSFIYEGSKNKILNNFNFSLDKGEILLIKGKSGIGKSTILRLISGLEELNEGEIYLDGIEISNLCIEKRNIGYLFQEYALFPNMNVEKNILYGMKNKNLKELNKLMKLIDLEGYEKRKPNELSGGEKQRVALARSLATYPKLLLLDEPFSSLNEELRDKIRKDIRSILKEVGISTIIVSHDSKDEIVVDRVITLG